MPSKISQPALKQVIKDAITKLERFSKSEAFLDALILLEHTIKKDRSWILAHDEEIINHSDYSNYKKLITKRANLWPIAYLIGEKYFYGHKFLVNKNVLIPRPESELIVEVVLNKLAESNKTFSLIDIGTGSGCLIISILLEDKAKKINKAIAIDISAKALTTAKANAKIYKLNKKLKFLKNNLLNNIDLASDKKTDELIILANLPYLTKKQMSESSIKHEPKLALLAKQDGLSLYRELKQQLEIIRQNFSKPITLICEINPQQKTAFKKIFPKTNFLKDLAKKTRLGIVNL